MKLIYLILFGLLILGSGSLCLSLQKPNELEGITVKSGEATVSRHWKTGKYQLHQSSNLALVNLNGVSLQQIEITKPPGAQTLFRVFGDSPSRLSGDLSSKTGVMVINPNGVIVGPAGIHNPRSNLIQSTLDSTLSVLPDRTFDYQGVPALGFGDRSIKVEPGDDGSTISVRTSLELEAHGSAYALKINNSGIIRATSNYRKNRRKVLRAIGSE